MNIDYFNNSFNVLKTKKSKFFLNIPKNDNEILYKAHAGETATQ